jgi:hypothetical protein
MLQRFLTGEFHVEASGNETWRATNRRAPGQIVLLRHIEAEAPLSAPATAETVTVTWNAGQPVVVTFSRGLQTVTVAAGAVFLHEPTGQLYAGLPLPTFTPAMRRFWRRVFLLVRIPGGRRAVGWLSRRSRGPA